MALLFAGAAAAGPALSRKPVSAKNTKNKHWLFIWRDMNDPKEVDRMIARFPRAQADGYNGVVFSYNVAPEKAAALRDAAKKYGLDLVAMVMGGVARPQLCRRRSRERRALRRAGRHGDSSAGVTRPRSPTAILRTATGNHFNGWSFQDDEGVTTFADHDVAHGGKTSLRMENSAKTSPATAASRSRLNCSRIASTGSPSGSRPKTCRPPIPKSKSSRRCAGTASVSRPSTPTELRTGSITISFSTA